MESFDMRALYAMRNAEIADLYFAGGDLEEMALKFGVTPLTIRQIAVGNSQGRRRPRSDYPRLEQVGRNAAICAEYSSGDSLAVVGARHGITRERVRQILNKGGVSERHNGFNSEHRQKSRDNRLSAEDRRAARKAARLARQVQIRDLYNAGLTYKEIETETGFNISTIQSEVWATGGPSRNAMAGKTNKRLTVADREEIVRLFSAGVSLPAIGSQFDICPDYAGNVARMHGARRPSEMRNAQ